MKRIISSVSIRKISFCALAVVLIAGAKISVAQFDDHSRATYIFDVVRYVTWPNENSIDTFRIAVLSKDDGLVRELRALTPITEVHGKPVSIRHYQSVGEIGSVQVVFLKKESGFDIDLVLYAIKGDNTLLISENFEFHKSMINFIVVKNKRRFELNTDLLKEEGFDVTVTFAALAVQTETDWKDLYREVNIELQQEKVIVESQKQLIEKQNTEIAEQTSRIEQLNSDISRRQEQIELQKRELEVRKRELDKLVKDAIYQQELISNKIRILDSQNILIRKSEGEIAGQQKILKDQKMQIFEQNDLISTQNELISEQDAKLLAQGIALGLFIVLLLACGALIFFIYRGYRVKKQSNLLLQEKNSQISAQKEEIEKEKERSDKLLLNILPVRVAEDLKQKGHTDPQVFREVSVMFSDIVGFTSKSSKYEPAFLISELNDIFTAFDQIIGYYHCERIKTIGDAYLAVCGMPVADPEHARRLMLASVDIIRYLKERNEDSVVKWEVRIGIHSGDVVGGVVGVKKYIYDVFGDTINTASRMESNSEAMQINVSETTYSILKDEFRFIRREPVEVKGKGKMEMFFLDFNY